MLGLGRLRFSDAQRLRLAIAGKELGRRSLEEPSSKSGTIRAALHRRQRVS
jgi:hypothetical protein